MVRHPLQGGNYYNPRDCYRNDQFNIPHDNRYVSAAPIPNFTAPIHAASINPQPNDSVPAHSRPQVIEDALKDCARIPVKAFALIVQLENGEDVVYSSPSLNSCREKIFTDSFKSNFRRSVRRSTAVLTNNTFSNHGLNADNAYNGFEGGYNRKHSGGDYSSSDSKKRRYPGHRQREGSFENIPAVPTRRFQDLLIGNTNEVEQFYFTRFKDMQQSSCKIMGKIFVKLLEPKKQTHYPYTKGAAQKPPWWPSCTDSTGVPHREPDHLLKPERIRLLVHIVRLIVQAPERQHPSVLKLGLNVQKLEEVTMEGLSVWFNDKDHLDNAKKRPFLKEIFRVAKAEESFNRGELDVDHKVLIMYGEPVNSEESDDENDLNDEEENEEDTQNIPGSTPGTIASMSSPSTMDQVSPTTMIAPQLHGNGLSSRTPLPMRQLEDQPQYTTDANTYYSSRSMSYSTINAHANVQDRRQYIHPPSYTAPQPLYSSNNWPMMNNSSQVSQQFFVTSPQQQALPQLPPMSQQHVLPLPTMSNFQDSFQRYDTAPALGNNTLRTGSMSHPHQHHQMTLFGSNPFLQDNGGFQTTSTEMKMEHQEHQKHQEHAEQQDHQDHHHLHQDQ